MMLIGIDVGGTYTDAVIIKDNQIISKTKIPTNHDNLVKSLATALDEVIIGLNPAIIRQVTFSTTLITNVIAENKYEPVALVIIPGPGLNPESHNFPADTWILEGATDYRGRQIASLDIKEINKVINNIISKGYNKVAVVGKFSQRNSSHEKQIAELFEKIDPKIHVELGHRVSGKINFPRRVNTTLFNAATKSLYNEFSEAVTKAMKDRKINAPVYILKADGATIPLKQSIFRPVETIFSGPAASTLGVIALTPKGKTSVVLDIGGTTTDLSLILNGEPLLSSQGAIINNYNTQVRSFAVKTIAIGGDSAVYVDNGKIQVGPARKGPAYCLGGPLPTPTDALMVIGVVNHGDFNKAREAMISIAQELGNIPPEVAASMIIEQVTNRIVSEIRAMFTHWENEPAYRVWEIMEKKMVRPTIIAGVGGAAAGILPYVAQSMKSTPLVLEHSEVANAIGAAVAQPTLTVTLHADTETGTYRILEEGYQGNCERNFNRDIAGEIINDWVDIRNKRLELRGISETPEIIRDEVFNIIRGYTLVGKIYDISVQTPWSIAGYIGQGGNSK